MRKTLLILMLLPIAACGCKDQSKINRSIMQGDVLLKQQREVWQNANASIQSPQPNLMYLRSMQMFLGGRTKVRVVQDYKGPNKDKIVALLDEMGKIYQDEVLSKVDGASFEVRLIQGASIDGIRASFRKLDEKFKQLDALVR